MKYLLTCFLTQLIMTCSGLRKLRARKDPYNIPVFLHSSISLVYCFIRTFFFSQIQIYCPLKNMFGLPQDIQFFFSKVIKFRTVKIFSLNYRCIVIICVSLLYIKEIRSRLRSQIIFA